MFDFSTSAPGDQNQVSANVGLIIHHDGLEAAWPWRAAVDRAKIILSTYFPVPLDAFVFLLLLLRPVLPDQITTTRSSTIHGLPQRGTKRHAPAEMEPVRGKKRPGGGAVGLMTVQVLKFNSPLFFKL